MHGHYELLHSTSSENRDLKPGEINLRKLGNLRFSSEQLPDQNPWARTALFSGDFILIAEFSENEGPKPVVSPAELILTHVLTQCFEKKYIDSYKTDISVTTKQYKVAYMHGT